MLRDLLVLAAVVAAAGTCANLKTAFDAHVGNHKVGGILRIQQKGKSAYTLFGGRLSIESTTLFSENTPFEIAGVTKSVRYPPRSWGCSEISRYISLRFRNPAGT